MGPDRLRNAILAIAAAIGMAARCAAQSEFIYTTVPGSIQQRDLYSLEVLRTCPRVHDSIQVGMDKVRIWGLVAPLALDYIERINPADGTTDVVGTTGLDWSAWPYGVDVEPQSGDLLVGRDQKLYVADKLTGHLTLLGPFSGMQTGDRVWALAARSPTEIYILGSVQYLPGARLYVADRTTMQAVFLGYVSNAGSSLGFRDLAVSQSGELFATWFHSPPGPPYNGLYRINLPGLSVTPAVTWTDPSQILGVAIAPGPPLANYCTAKVNSLHCIPTIHAVGFASVAATSGCEVRAFRMVNNTSGRLLFSLSGPAATAFHGGILCLATPYFRTPAQSSGGNSPPAIDCSGTWSLDLDTWFHSGVPLPPGTTVRCQWIGRDPGFAAPANWQLTDALEVTFGP